MAGGGAYAHVVFFVFSSVFVKDELLVSHLQIMKELKFQDGLLLIKCEELEKKFLTRY